MVCLSALFPTTIPDYLLRLSTDDLEGPFLTDLLDIALSSPKEHFKYLGLTPILSSGYPNHFRLVRCHQELRLVRQLTYERGYGGSILGIESVIKLVEDVEWSRVELEYSEDQSDNDHSFLAS